MNRFATVFWCTPREDLDMKSDKQLKIDIAEELKWEPRIRDEEIGVEVRDGIVTLMGTVPDYAQRMRAERAVERVSGVRAVAQELTVKVPNTHRHSDTDLARHVANTIEWDTEIPFHSVKAKVEDGWVTLEGEVEWQFQRNAPERAIRYLAGVKGVSNFLKVKAHASTYDVAKHISAALSRSGEAEAKAIKVTADGGKVTLTGTVRSWPERADAQRAAWSATGVTEVDDRLAVGFC